MFTKEVTVKNETGLHARPAGELVKLCKSFEGKVELVTMKDGAEKVLNAKNLLQVMSGGLTKGKVFTLRVEGEGEEKAGEEIANFIESFQE